MKKICTVAFGLAVALAAGGALADKGGHGHGNHGRGNDDVTMPSYGAGPGCPPGLAKKNNGCLPPGQAKKLAVGQRLPRDITWSPVAQPALVNLPPLQPGYQYVRVNNDVVLLRPGGIIANIFANLG